MPRPMQVFGSIFAIFGIIALAMASVAIYGVTAYGVTQRTQEIGVRVALGARRPDVLWLVLRQGLIRIAAGLGIGLVDGPNQMDWRFLLMVRSRTAIRYALESRPDMRRLDLQLQNSDSGRPAIRRQSHRRNYTPST